MEEGNEVNQYKYDQTKLWNRKRANPANLLEKFSSDENFEPTKTTSSSQPLPEPDLNLRLSVGSIYGGNSVGNPLTRSSSIAEFISLRNSWAESEINFLSLTRACSLPTVTEQEQRLTTIRELQTMRRTEAKNRFLEKQRSLREAKEKQKFPVPVAPMPTLPSEVAAWAAASAANSPALCRAILKIKTHGLSPSNRRGLQGAASPKWPSSFKAPSVPDNAQPAVTSATTSNGIFLQEAEARPENQHKKARMSCSNFEDNGMDVMRQMPSVSTTGEGPNGRRIEGFLYTYMRGHVCIVCICHGSFLSPAEFVKHAGGKDVPNPMKHITVYSTFAS